MRLSDAMSVERIVDLKATSKDEAIAELKVPGHLPLLLLGTALVVTHVAHGIADYVRDTHELPLHLEPLLICVTAGFTVRNLSAGGDRFAEAIHSVSLPVFVLFFCLAGASLDLQSLRTTWAAALLYVVVRRFPDWGAVFATIAVAAISINQLIGPVAMKLALQSAHTSQTRS
mgnify:CR=1 FL=1